MRVNNLRLSIHAFSDTRELSEIAAELDAFIIKNSKNPFMLSVFIQEMMESTIQKGDTPKVLVFMADGKIVGVAPLSITKKFGIRFAELLFDYDVSPDFIFDTEYRGVCMQNSLTFIFDHLRCQIATLDFPIESLNLNILERTSKINHIHLRKKTAPYLNHSIIPIDRKWTDFQKSQSKNFRHRFKQIERHLSKAGQWRILLHENEDQEHEVFREIMDIEKTSWKQSWRLQHHRLVDESLVKFWWEGPSLAIRTYQDFKRSTWLLELNGCNIAYSLVVQYKETAYITKTSYNNQYRKIYPGIYINNVAIQNLFDNGGIKTIDLLTHLPFHEIWKSKHLSRVRFLMWKGFLPNLYEWLIQRPQIQIMWRLITSRQKD